MYIESKPLRPIIQSTCKTSPWFPPSFLRHPFEPLLLLFLYPQLFPPLFKFLLPLQFFIFNDLHRPDHTILFPSSAPLTSLPYYPRCSSKHTNSPITSTIQRRSQYKLNPTKRESSRNTSQECLSCTWCLMDVGQAIPVNALDGIGEGSLLSWRDLPNS